MMASQNDNLIWLDMEMSGLSPENDRILEVAAVVTDAELNVLAESPVLVVHQSDAVLDGMDAWNKGTHGRSGLIDKVKASSLDEAGASAQMIEFLKSHVPAGKSPMCGNSICQDRRFMARYMPELGHISITATSMSACSRSWRGAGNPLSTTASKKPASMRPWLIFMSQLKNLSIIASTSSSWISAGFGAKKAKKMGARGAPEGRRSKALEKARI